MIINVPVIIPDDSLFRIRLSDGRLYGQWGEAPVKGRGRVFCNKSSAHCCITYNSLKGAKIEVLKPEVVISYPYNPFGLA